MKNIFVVIILIPVLIIYSREMDKKKITFIVKTDSLTKNDTVYITGNDIKLGEWNPKIIPLIRDKNNNWKKEFIFDSGTTIEYKFTLGSWDKEAIDKNNSVPSNYVLNVSGDTVITYEISKWGKKENNFKGKITGKVEYYRDMEGDKIKPRDIIVWLPPNYEKSRSKKYPVLYMHDGQNVFDPLTSFNGVDWQADETADSLIKQGRMKEIIIVGIYNTSARSSEYSYSDTGYCYMNFIIKKLKPFIDKKYRTLKSRLNTATIGSSMGGLISFMLVWEHPEVFSMAGCLSPALKIDGINIIPKISAYKGRKKPVKFYFDNGGIGLEKELQPGLNETTELLKKKGYKLHKDFELFIDKTAEHNEAAWAKRLWRPLLFMFGKK